VMVWVIFFGSMQNDAGRGARGVES
jgi:hypothetical protein